MLQFVVGRITTHRIRVTRRPNLSSRRRIGGRARFFWTLHLMQQWEGPKTNSLRRTWHATQCNGGRHSTLLNRGRLIGVHDGCYEYTNGARRILASLNQG